ncbi:MAG TPA: hypothetical protein VHU89_09505 [Acidobacteriaceae bacterium]|jgi:hypothetical protein|nr:hypothetical protein [Acidobacteriaceae bacterium]
MGTKALYWIASLVLLSGVPAVGQNLPMVKPAPEFTLSISQIGYGGTLPGNYAVEVREKNISDGLISGSDCSGFGDWLNLSVLYNGVPLPTTDAVKHLEKVRRAGGPCGVNNGGWKIAPGEEQQFPLYITQFYPMRKPGTYEITVTKETEPLFPVMSTTVKSNTISVVVP